jgi:hypothetical protein
MHDAEKREGVFGKKFVRKQGPEAGRPCEEKSIMLRELRRQRRGPD